MKRRVVVAMSGGVDSAVAAALLLKKGCEVVGMTMCFNLPGAVSGKPSCCGLQGIEDARRTAQMLGIRHYVINAQKALQERVIDDFCREYARGRTPNPCVLCNRYLKFDMLLKKALALDAQYLATGHYARIAEGHRSKVEGRRYVLQKGKDAHKDQSYFLYRLGQEQLKNILFPLGDLTKTRVRELARGFGLSVAEKAGSQEICFVAGRDYREFLAQRIPLRQRTPGPIVDTGGNVLGRHKGIVFYTVGQRQGLGIASRHPLYVVRIDAARNEITAGPRQDAFKSEFSVSGPHWINPPVKKKIAARVKIRYNQIEQPVGIRIVDDHLEVRFREPQFAVTPGQSAVFYQRSTVLGGGRIDKVQD